MPVAPKLQHQSYSRSRELNAQSLFRRILDAVNFPLLIVVALLTAYGLVVVHSAIEGRTDYTFSRQLTGVGIGVVAMGLVWWFDYRKLATLAFPLLIVTMILVFLPLVPGLGINVNGARNWVVIFGQQIQPGEFAKPFIVLYAAALGVKHKDSIRSGKEYFKVLVLLMLPVICIVLQPDLGTGLVFFMIGMAVLLTGGAKRKWLIITAVVLILALVMLIVVDGLLDNLVGTDVLIKEYQKNRILVFLNEDIDPTGVGHNLRQAKIAIGSGGLFGKGLGNATQSGLGFLPEAPTDFIFCVLAEQFGFMGCITLIGLYVVLLFIALRIALNSNNLFGKLIVSGIMGMWVFQIFENIGMGCGLMPITGIPLPFMSYGSSFMVVNFMLVGLLCSVWSRRDSKMKK